MAHSFAGSVYSLEQPLGGLFGNQFSVRSESDDPRFFTRVIRLGDISQLFPPITAGLGPHSAVSILGVGAGLTDQEAKLPALCEAVERYCSSGFCEDNLFMASAEELGNRCLDLEHIPRCSESELANSRCPLTMPTKRSPIRWVLGISVFDGKPTYVPAVMTFTHIRFASTAERICFPLSTGCAAHTSLEGALLSGIFEVVERDAIATVWLQKLPLPRIVIDCTSEILDAHLQALAKRSNQVEYFFFDATTDIGFPTVYGIQSSSSNREGATFVACATAADGTSALIKVIRDFAHSRVAFRQPAPVPDHVEDFTTLAHGATYMARIEHVHAFDFLLMSGARRKLSEMPSLRTSDKRSMLAVAVNQLESKRLDAFAVELSTDEALRAGLRVIKIIIPALQPLSFHHRARFLGHPRLYQAPRQMGYRSLDECELNPFPQPFA